LGGALWLAAVVFWLGGVNLYSLGSLLVMLALTTALSWNETHFERPLRSYGRLAIGSALLLFVLVVSVLLSGGSVLLGALTWAVMSLLAAIWTIYYERTEPLA
jgi:hypothetical protein